MSTVVTVTPVDISVNVTNVNRTISITESSKSVTNVTNANVLINVNEVTNKVTVNEPTQVKLNVTSPETTVVTASTLVFGSIYTTGVITVDFGSGAMSTSVIVTGVSKVKADSLIDAHVRIEATPEHDVIDMLIDPIRIQVHELIAGVGFTITATMDNAPANGTYNINWILY